MIRRRPPNGPATQPCGIMAFSVPSDDADAKPRNILEEIVWYKAVEIEDMRARVPLPRLMAAAAAQKPAHDFIGALKARAAASGRPALIAEIKKASPSRGVLQPDFDPVRIARAYEEGGAACLSVLTDKKFFQGDYAFIERIRAAGVTLPILAKEFVVEAYQILKARASGADCILLIAAVLPNADLKLLLATARRAGVQALIEVHTQAELERVLSLDSLDGAFLGINNRDLGTFEVELGNTGALMASPAGARVKEAGLVMTCESGIFTPADVAYAAGAGCGALLVGESLVREGDPAAAVKKLLG